MTTTDASKTAPPEVEELTREERARRILGVRADEVASVRAQGKDLLVRTVDKITYLVREDDSFALHSGISGQSAAGLGGVEFVGPANDALDEYRAAAAAAKKD